MRKNLLSAQRERDRPLARKSPGFIKRVRVERLRPAKNGRESLNRCSYDVVAGLLPCEGAAGGLRVKPKLEAALVPRAIAPAHGLGPDFARRAVLGDLLEEIVMRIEKEAEARSELIGLIPSCEHPLDVFHAIAQREREFLCCRRSSLANVITANGNGVVSRRVPDRELD